MKDAISLVIHARNAQQQIEECINSAQLLTDSIVVVDAGSTDKTANIARSCGATVYPHAITEYVELARTFDVEKSPGPWIFIMDADERMTPELAQEVKETISQNQTHSHYRIPRKNIFAQRRWLKHGGWWPDYVSGRLLYKPDFVTWPLEIHSKPIMKGSEGILRNPFLHYFHSNLENMVVSTSIYENIEAELLCKAGRSVTTLTVFRKYLGEFFRRFFVRFGYLDKTLGIIESIYQAYSKTITWILVYEKNRSHSK